jgi:hypothetical protein
MQHAQGLNGKDSHSHLLELQHLSATFLRKPFPESKRIAIFASALGRRTWPGA